MRAISKLTILCLAAATMTAVFATGALAAAAPQGSAAQAAESDAGQATPDDPDQATQNQRRKKRKEAAVSLGTVVVTATRRLRPLQSVPGSVTALEGSFLDQIHAPSFEQFASFVPGLSYNSLGPTSDLIAIRGVTTGGTQLSGGIGMYLDEVPIGASTPFGLGFQTIPLSTFDLSRIEVLNGPQGTLYGANALGGALKYVPTAPDLYSFGGLIGLGASQTAHAGTNGDMDVMVNAPIATGKVAVRVDAVQRYDSGFAKNVLLDRDNRGSSHTTMGRVQLLAQVTPDLSIKFLGSWQKLTGDGLNVDFRNIATGQPVLGTYKQAFGLHQTELNSLSLASLIVSWNLDWATFTSISGDQNNVGTAFTDLSDVYNPLLAPLFGTQLYGFLTDTSTRKYTQEFRLQSNDDTGFQWLVGAYFDYEKTHELVHLQDNSDPQGLLFGFAPFYGVLPSDYHEQSVFADGTWHFTDQFSLTLGGRESRNTQRYQQFAHGLLVVPTDPALTTHEDATSSQSVATWLINPSYQISKSLMVYGKVASGYRPGGPNFVLALGQGAPTFQPDKLWDYELGEKASFLGGRADLNVDVFDIEWSKIQLTVNNGGVNQIENGGDARIKGAELRTDFRVTPQLMLSGSGAWIDAKLTSAVPALGLAQPGARLPLSPRIKLAAAATYSFPIAGGSSADLTVSDAWIGDRMAGYAGSAVSPGYRLPGYNTLNLDLAVYAPHGIEVDAFVHNALDRVGQVSATTIANEYDPTAPVPVILSRPRTVGIQLTVALGNP